MQMMTDQEKKELRSFYCKEYLLKTGCILTCVEKIRLSPKRCKKSCTDNIVRLSSLYTKIPEADITSKSRKRNLIDIRMMMVAILKEYKVTLEEAATILGHGDHSTAVNALRRHNEVLAVDKDYKIDWFMYKKYIRTEVQKIHEASHRYTTPEDREIIRNRIISGESKKDIESEYKLSRSAINKIVAKKY